MAQIIGLPKLSPTMEEGVLVRWTKKEGDKVSPGDLVAEVETDKANMDFNIEDEGVLLKLLAKEGDTVKLGAPVAIIGKAGEDVSALVAEAAKQGPSTTASAAPPKGMGAEDSANAPAAQKKPVAAEQRAAQGKAPAVSGQKAAPPQPKAAAKPAAAPRPDGGGKLLASPLAKTLAIELGIDLRTIQGSGPGGRIVERDVRAAAEGGGNGHARAVPTEAAPVFEEAPAPTQALAVRHARQMVPDTEADYTDVPATNMRKTIAARLTEAKRDVPHFYLMRQIDAAPMLAFRGRLNDLLGDKGKVSVNDLIVKAVALALRRVPECNAAWEGDAIRYFNRVHIGVAVALPEGLVTPVVRDADQKGIGAIAAEVRDLAERAKSKRLKGHEITGSTFSVSNLGMMGIERFTAIINPPEAGILAIGTVVDTPVVKDGQVVPGKRMTVTMSCDHRVIDGALGARWLGEFVDLIEKPESLAL
ncbi:MAG TPA: pyruvate dehydrogenase complex dihydrolipoamide acetyltransferase [Kofleriaceae bacterium]|nr:pyruvate dehydrogenase complex dihydrolipoamide acetyltransferase [Kofleriaceae bacterium]